MVNFTSILGKRTAYKPFQFPWAYDCYRLQQQQHWLATDANLSDDIEDFRARLSDEERAVITRILQYFTQTEGDICSGYTRALLPRFELPELQMMLTSFAAMEGVHADAYDLLGETLGLTRDRGFYASFMETQTMRERHSYLEDLPYGTLEELTVRVAVFGGFVEGVQLYGAFAILKEMARDGRMKGMGQIVSWVAQDESLHCASLIKLTHHLMQEIHGESTRIRIREKITQAARDIVEMDEAFTRECVDGPWMREKQESFKVYPRYLADRRLESLGVKPIFNTTTDPIPEITAQFTSPGCANFFENHVTEYGKGQYIDDLNHSTMTLEEAVR